MKNGAPKKLLALVLVMTLILSLGLTAAFAEGEAENTCIEVTETAAQDGVTVYAEVPAGQSVDVAVSDDQHTVTVDAGTGASSCASAAAQGETVTVEVNIPVSGEGSEHDIGGVNYGVGVYAEGSDSQTAPQVVIDLNGHAVSVGPGETQIGSIGVYAEGNTITVTGAGEVTAAVSYEMPEDPDESGGAIAVYAKQGAAADLNSAEAEGWDATAINAIGDNTSVEAGTATATAYITATAVNAASGAEVKVETAAAETKDDTNDANATAILTQFGGTVEANAATAKTVYGTARGIAVEEAGGEVTADTVSAESENGSAIAISVVVSDGQEKVSSVSVKGDAESSGTGILVDGDGDGKAAVEIGGTLKVADEGTPVLLGSGVTEDNIAITVWKIEIDGRQAKEGEIVQSIPGGETDAAKAVEESIQYVIKIDPRQAENLKASRETAKANETFTVTVIPPDGKKLDAVYSDINGEIEATLNDDGTYTVTVRVGGGMYLSAQFSDKPADPTPDPLPDPDPNPAPAPVPVPVPPSVDTGTAAANDWAKATVRLEPENGAYTLTLTGRDPAMTFLRQTLEKFAKYNDTFVISTPYGDCEISLAELLNFNEKAVNFRVVITDTALEIYVNGELFRSIPTVDLT